MESRLGDNMAQPEERRKVSTNLTPELLASLRAKCDNKANVTLLGIIQGKHPGLKTLTGWARENLHSSLVLLSLKSKNVFEVSFDAPEGRIHALNQTDLIYESAVIYFSSWRPHFDPEKAQATDKWDHPIWVQIADLDQVLREDESFLRTIGELIGQVISIDNSEVSRAKLFGPRIKLLVRDLNSLPHTVEIPRLDGEGMIEYTLEFNGLPNQCGRCQAYDHQVRYCPKKEVQTHR
jgi:hypothetical protein